MTLTTDAVLNRFKQTSINVPEVRSREFLNIKEVIQNDALYEGAYRRYCA